MDVTSSVRKLVREAMAKQAADKGENRNQEHTKDIKSMIPASVDSQSAADATGLIGTTPAATIGTKAEASTDKPVEGTPTEGNDDQAFKTAHELRFSAKSILNDIKEAAEKSAADAVTVEPTDGGAAVPNIPVDDGGLKSDSLGPADGKGPQADKSVVQNSPTKQEETTNIVDNPPKQASQYAPGALAYSLYKLAHDISAMGAPDFCKAAGVEELNDEALTEEEIDGLPDEEADEVAAALEAAAMEAAAEGAEDADTASDYLGGYMEGAMEPSEEEMLAELAAAEAEAGGAGGSKEDEIDVLTSVLEQAGISPDELAAATAKQASAQRGEWGALSKEAKRKVVLDVLANMQNGGA